MGTADPAAGLLDFLLELEPHTRCTRISRGKLRLVGWRWVETGWSRFFSARAFSRGLRKKLAAGLGAPARRLSALQAVPRIAARLEEIIERGRLRLALSQGREALRDFEWAHSKAPSRSELLLWKAKCRLVELDLESALADLNAYLRARTGSPGAYALRGETRRLLGRPAEALADFDRALRLAPADPDLHALRGNLRPRSLDAALRLDPEHYWARLLRSVHRARTGAHAKALDDIDALIRLDPQVGWAHVLRGDALSSLKRPGPAERSYRRALHLDSLCGWAYSPATRERGFPPFHCLADLAPIEEEVRGLVLRTRTTPEAMASVILGDLLYDSAWVLRHVEEGARLDPDNPWILGVLARAEAFSKRLEPALAHLDRAVRLHPDCAWLYWWRGEIRGRRGDHEGALADYDRCLALNPLEARAYARRGLSLLQLGRHEESVAALDEGLQANEGYAAAYQARYEARLALKDPAASNDLETAVSLEFHRFMERKEKPRPSGAASRFPWAALARVERRARRGVSRPDDRELASVVREHPGLAWPYALRAQAHAGRSQWRRAAGDLDLFLALSGKPFGAITLRARCKRLAGGAAEAVADLSSSLRLLPEQREALYERALSYRDQEEFLLALRDLEALSRQGGGTRWFFDPARDGEAGPYERALAEPCRFDAWTAALQLKLGRFDDARRLIRGPARSRRERAWKNLVEAGLSLQEGRSDEARARLTSGPRDESLRSLVSALKGELAYQGADYESALKGFDLAIRAEPDCFGYRVLRARIRESLGDWTGRLDDLSAALELSPHQAWLLAWRGKAHVDTGRFDEGIDDLERALALCGTYSEARDWLDEAHRRRALPARPPQGACAPPLNALDMLF